MSGSSTMVDTGKRRCPICDLVMEAPICPADRVATYLRGAPLGNIQDIKRGSIIADRYEIEGLLGQGAFGAVFSARQIATGQQVALKIMLNRGESFEIRRFFTEARVTASLRHPNTVRVFDFGSDDGGFFYMAMELLAGHTLKAEIRQRFQEGKRFSEAEAIKIGVEVTRSLGEAHAAGLVHRDLKTDNVFLQYVEGDDPVIKVVDFGIARLPESQLTQASGVALLGTPAYMSPEQARNETLDGRADLYSLGVILFELATGAVPFRGARWEMTIFMHLNEPVPDIRTRTEQPLSDAFVEIVTRALQKQPSARFADAGAMRSALLAAGGSSPSLREDRTMIDPEPRPPSRGSATNASSAIPLTHFTGLFSGLADDLGSQKPAIGATVDGRYRLEAIITQTKTRAVYKGRRLADAAAVAIKIVDLGAAPDPARVALLEQEAQRLRALEHPQIPRFIEHFTIEAAGSRFFCFVREHAEGRSIATELELDRRGVDEAHALDVVADLLGVLKYLHKQTPPVVHGALDPRHLIRRESDGKIALLGFDALTGAARPTDDIAAVGLLAVELLTASRIAPEARATIDVEKQCAKARSQTRALIRSLLSAGERGLEAGEALARVERVREMMPGAPAAHQAPAPTAPPNAPPREPRAPAPIAPSAARREPATGLSKDALQHVKSLGERIEAGRRAEEKSNPFRLVMIVAALIAVGMIGSALIKRGSGTSEPRKIDASVFKNQLNVFLPMLERNEEDCDAPPGRTLRLHMAIFAATGKVGAVSVESDGGKEDSALESCLARGARAFEFAIFGDTGFIVTDLPLIEHSGTGLRLDYARSGSVFLIRPKWEIEQTEPEVATDAIEEVLGRGVTAIEPCFATAYPRLDVPDRWEYPAVFKIAGGEATPSEVGLTGGEVVDWTNDARLSACIGTAISSLKFTEVTDDVAVHTKVTATRQPMAF